MPNKRYYEKAIDIANQPSDPSLQHNWKLIKVAKLCGEADAEIRAIRDLYDHRQGDTGLVEAYDHAIKGLLDVIAGLTPNGFKNTIAEIELHIAECDTMRDAPRRLQ